MHGAQLTESGSIRFTICLTETYDPGALCNAFSCLALRSAASTKENLSMPKGYLFGEIEVHDPDEYEKYRAKVPETIAAYGGRYLVRGGDNPEIAEGEPNPKIRTVILEFPSRERLFEWYNSPEYRPVRDIRFRSAKTNVWVMSGLD